MCDWGIPNAVISDKDPKFTGASWRGLFEGMKTKLTFTASYQPQADGQSEQSEQSERRNQQVETGCQRGSHSPQFSHIG